MALSKANLAPSVADTGVYPPTNSSPLPVLQEAERQADYHRDFIPLTFETKHQPKALTVVAQMHLMYLVCKDDQGSIYLIDQHAADERVRYEQQLAMLADKKFAVAPLVPVMVDIKPSEAKLLTEERLKILADVGIELVKFGGNAYKVNSVPSWTLSQAQFYVEDLLHQLFEEPQVQPDKLRLYALASKACKTSIKAQDTLTLEAMQSLVDRLFQCEYPYTCPHGRPTMIQFSKRQLEAMFNRSGF
jgi:DNA mismatch repair protein MutL